MGSFFCIIARYESGVRKARGIDRLLRMNISSIPERQNDVLPRRIGAGVHNDITVPDVHRIGPVAEKIEIVDGGTLADQGGG